MWCTHTLWNKTENWPAIMIRPVNVYDSIKKQHLQMDLTCTCTYVHVHVHVGVAKIKTEKLTGNYQTYDFIKKNKHLQMDLTCTCTCRCGTDQDKRVGRAKIRHTDSEMTFSEIKDLQMDFTCSYTRCGTQDREFAGNFLGRKCNELGLVHTCTYIHLCMLVQYVHLCIYSMSQKNVSNLVPFRSMNRSFSFSCVSVTLGSTPKCSLGCSCSCILAQVVVVTMSGMNNLKTPSTFIWVHFCRVWLRTMDATNGNGTKLETFF